MNGDFRTFPKGKSHSTSTIQSSYKQECCAIFFSYYFFSLVQVFTIIELNCFHHDAVLMRNLSLIHTSAYWHFYIVAIVEKNSSLSCFDIDTYLLKWSFVKKKVDTVWPHWKSNHKNLTRISCGNTVKMMCFSTRIYNALFILSSDTVVIGVTLFDLKTSLFC